MPDDVIGARLRTPRVDALVRQRVDELLDGVWQHPITLVVAPAGSGKTTTLAQFASRSPDPVAWYRADSADGSVARLLAHLEAALTAALPGLAGGWASVDDAAVALDHWQGRRAALVIDDLHALRGTPAEALVERLVDYLPPHVRVAAASRTLPSFDLTRLRLNGHLLHIGADDLRFRTWEAEQLFRDVYHLPLAPEDLARLTRRVEGWAAGLQLYHLAARSKPPAEQRRLIDLVSSRSRLAREYLTRNVLDTLPAELRDFLVDTSVLGVVTPGLADRLLGRSDGAKRLRELEQLQLFTIPLDDEGTYRYHEVLRSHLEVLLAERDGDDELRRRHHTAGSLLAEAGFVAEALRCFGRSGDWEAVSALLGGDDQGHLANAHEWLDTMPSSIVEHDPWLLLARARAATAAGHLHEAVTAFQSAEVLFGDTPPGERCQRERLDLQSWLDPMAQSGTGWTGQLRSGLQRDPRGAIDVLVLDGDPASLNAAGILAVLLADFRLAVELVGRAMVHPAATIRHVVVAKLVAAIADLLGPVPDAADLVDDVEATAERLGLGIVARLARATLAVTERTELLDEASRVTALCDADGDPWGAEVARLLEAFGRLRTGEAPVTLLDDAVARARALHSPLLESAALGALALAMGRAHHAETRAVALAAEHLGRQVGSLGARAMAHVALAGIDEGEGPAHLQEATDLAAEGGFRLPGTRALDDGPPDAPVDTAAPALELQVFGPCTVRVAGAELDLSVLRPRARSALRLLALHAPRPVHKEVLAEALWPGGDPEAAVRGLQTAVSSVRQLLAAAGATAVLVRDGDAYRLAVSTEHHDLRRFDRAVAAAQAARAAGDDREAGRWATAAVALYEGDLLIEEGPAEWAVAERDRCRADASAAAVLAADVALAEGRSGEAAGLCEHGLRIDRFHDGLWRLLADAYEQAGDRAAATRARRSYDEVMRELGVAG
jgi:DNA-binding SARP family transcriptional activator/ribosomal protein S15P/S13E